MANVLVIRAAGTNCDTELVRAFRLAGAEPTLVHLDALIADATAIDRADIIALPGGFSYGDDIASGRVFAAKLRAHLQQPMLRAVDRGACVLGVCNGFQILVQLGLLPGLDRAPDAWPAPTAALVENAGGRFIDDWVKVRVESDSPCIWTRSWAALSSKPQADDLLQLPIAHGEGRLVCASEDDLKRLMDAGCAPLRYVNNPNGSSGDIAGLCDPTGRVFGLMPHPERYIDWNRHPCWTRLSADVRKGDVPGLLCFKDAVSAVAAQTV